jgi:hypothetical protein
MPKSPGCNERQIGRPALADDAPIQPLAPTLQDENAWRQGVEQFNAGHFFQAHETWEEVWLRTPEPEKTFLQGIIQVAAAFHHYSRGNVRGARSLLEAGLGRLSRFPTVHRGIDLAALRTEAQTWAGSLAAGRLPGPDVTLPQIRWAPPED